MCEYGESWLVIGFKFGKILQRMFWTTAGTPVYDYILAYVTAWELREFY